jgi:subtilisin family serine protease
VFVNVVGDARSVASQLDQAHTTRSGDVSLVVGSLPTQQLVKLASDPKVVSVRSITFKRDGTPVDFEDHHPAPLSGAAKARAVAATRGGDVPYSEAPPPRGSSFDQFKKLNVLDAKTHNFTEAWNAGITGEGTTVAVFDSGTDWSHPDLIGAKVATDASGWPAAFDPFGTLQWLAAPSQINQGLSWYVRTTAATCTSAGDTCQVQFATRTGPSRNLPNPPGTRTHTYSFPKAWSKSGTVRLGSHPDDWLLDFYGERPAFLVTDPNTAGVYDTIYVDLNDDFDFSDEKPVTKQSPRSWRDLNGDGFVDLSGAMAYYISDGTGPSGRPVPGGLEAFGVSIKAAPGGLVAWTGDFDPAIGGHGTLCTSNVVGQGVTNGNLPTFSDIPGGKYPSAVVGGAPHAVVVVDLAVPGDRVPAGGAELGRRADLDAGHRSGRRGGAEARRAVAAGEHRRGAPAEGGVPDVGLLAGGVEAVVVGVAGAVGVRGDVDPPGVRQEVGELGREVEAEVDVAERDHGVRQLVRPRPRLDRQQRHGHRGRRRLLGRRDQPGPRPRGGQGRAERLGDLGWHQPLDPGHRRRDRAGVPGVPGDPPRVRPRELQPDGEEPPEVGRDRPRL